MSIAARRRAAIGAAMRGTTQNRCQPLLMRGSEGFLKTTARVRHYFAGCTEPPRTSRSARRQWFGGPRFACPILRSGYRFGASSFVNVDDATSGPPAEGLLMESQSWTVTLDVAYPEGVSEIDEMSMHRFLDSIALHRGALNIGRFGHRGLAVTVSINASELEQSTSRSAAERGEAIVRANLQTIGLSEDSVLETIEVSAEDEHQIWHLSPAVTTK